MFDEPMNVARREMNGNAAERREQVGIDVTAALRLRQGWPSGASDSEKLVE